MQPRPIHALLIANRGEIACRIAETCQEMRITSVAVYSEADRHALHVSEADRGFLLGPPEAAKSYLNQERIIEAARATGADAVHPGYGFLAENAEFAEAVIAAGLVWVGPHPEAIRGMGSKIHARRLAHKLNIPVVPGYDGDAQGLKKLQAEAEKIGYPLMIKASAGGGGKGIRIVNNAAEMTKALDLAKKEAKAAFGDDKVILERYIPEPRHVEVQILGDKHGNVVHFFTRDCSIQRRHQKLVEEAPAPNLPPEVREQLHESAVRLAKAINYDNAGTVEFIYDSANAQFFFLEMNTRLQVEHPVTEEIVPGLDLVKEQINAAAGYPLQYTQDKIELSGAAIEVRINAEDPANDFRPQTGNLKTSYGPGNVRVDTGIPLVPWDEHVISPHYDSLLMKVIAWESTRQEAIAVLLDSLKQFPLFGVTTNKHYLESVIGHPAFQDAQLSTHFIEHHMADWKPPAQVSLEDLAAAALGFVLRLEGEAANQSHAGPWASLGPWRLWRNAGYPGLTRVVLDGGDGQRHTLGVSGVAGEYTLTWHGETHRLRAAPHGHVPGEEDMGYELSLEIDGVLHKRIVAFNKERTKMFVYGGPCELTCAIVPPAGQYVSERHQLSAAGHGLVAPYPGLVTEVAVKPGDHVNAGDTLLVMEAMKMIQHLAAEGHGVVKAVHCRPNQSVETGKLLVEFETGDAAT